MKNIRKRIWAGLLALCLIIGVFPVGTQAALVDGSDYIAQQMYLGDDLMLHLRGCVNYLYAENAVATVAYGDKVDTYRLEDLTVADDGQAEIVIDLAAAQLTDQIDLTIKVGNVLVLEETYSIRAYIESLLEGNYTWQTKQLCREMLNYGARAQEYFGYKSDAAADADYETEPANPVPEQMPLVTVNGAVPGIHFYGTSVRFISQTAVRFYFKADNGMNGLSFSVDGKAYTPQSKDGLYYIEVPGLKPQDMVNKMQVAVTDGSKTLTVDYAAIDFFVRSYHKATEDTYRSLMAAAYSYFVAARQFVDVGSVGALNFTAQTGTANTIKVVTDLPSDIPVVDFKLSENGCFVSEDANLYQTASKVQMAKADDKILLTFCFDSNFEAGQTYTLPKNAIFGFTDYRQFALTRDYIFAFDGSSWSIVEPEGDFRNGVNFEAIGNTLLFTGAGRNNEAATITRVPYSSVNMAKPSNSGSYALRLSHKDSDPIFRVNFGRQLAARTKLTFMAYNTGTRSSISICDSDMQTGSLFTKSWTSLTLTLPEAAEYVDLRWNTGDKGGTVYFDNFYAEEPVEAANLLLGFESYAEMTGAKLAVGNMLGRMEINKDIRYITQGDASLKVAPQGDYGKTGHNPYFKLDMLDSTAKFNDFSNIKSISFDVYNAQNKQLHISMGLVTGENYQTYLTTNKQTFTLEPNSWTTCHYDLTYMAGYQFYDLANVRFVRFEFLEHKKNKDDVPNVFYIDNLRADAYGNGEGPVKPECNYTTGIDFETTGQEYLFTGQGVQNRDAEIEKITYYSTGTVAAPAGGGNYGIRLRHESNYWPTFRLHFGEKLEAGTEITFMAYGKIIGESLYNQSVFEFSSGGDATNQFECGKWTQLYLMLPEDAEYIDLFWNIDRAGITSAYASGEVYIDNIIIMRNEPDGNILEGYGFEERGNAERITGQGVTNDATIKRMTYSALDLTAPEDCGEYALKLTHASSQTPTFRINFGQRLAEGTTISFKAYAKLISGYIYPKKNVFKYSDGSNATGTFDFKVWKDLTITLQEAAEYIDLTWSFKGSFGSAVCELYLDNIKAVEPKPEAGGDFTAGVGFEESGNELLFGGIGANQDATIERVAYADLGVNAPSNGGSYALKVSHGSFNWPTFRMNFGKAMKAGTVITFDVYGNYDYAAPAGVNKYMKLELNANSKSFAKGDDANQLVWTLVETWATNVKITLTADTSYIDFFYNVADGQHGEVASWLLIDNIKAT